METKKLEELIVPIKQKSKKVRVGWDEDGGYVCLKDSLRNDMTVLSFGVGPCIEFEMDLLKNYKAYITCYDESVEIPKETLKANPRLKYVKEFLTKDNVNSIFDEHEYPLLVQMDIEGCEFDFLETVTPENLQKIETLILEFHFAWPLNIGLPRIENALRILNETHVCYHIHGNNHLGNFIEGTGIPIALECSYIKKDLSTTKEVDNQTYPLKGLDFPNARGRIDFPLNWWCNNG